jgi:hypothetical protein
VSNLNRDSLPGARIVGHLNTLRSTRVDATSTAHADESDAFERRVVRRQRENASRSFGDPSRDSTFDDLTCGECHESIDYCLCPPKD